MRLSILFLTLLAALFAGGCALDRFSLTRPFASLTRHTQERLPPARLQKEIDTRLAAKDFTGALELIHAALEGDKEEEDFARQLPAALNGVLSQALENQRLDHPLEAGSLYRTARIHYPRTQELQTRTWMTLTEIDASIELCASRLLESGLLAYRNGEYEKAIATWESIATFHPDHLASQRAIATTRTQLKNLERLENP